MTDLVVITGVSRGIGKACALAFATRGARLALVGRPSEGQEATRAACEALGTDVRAYACDVAEREDVERVAAQLLADQGCPAVVINNAGMLERGPKVHEIDVALWDRILAVNLRGPFLVTRALLPAMLEVGRGRFLHVSSISGTIGCPHMAHYGTSKWGLLGFHAALSDELRGTGVMSIAILPGSVDTDMLSKVPFPPDMSPEAVAEVMVYYGLDAPVAIAGARVQVYG